MRFHELLLQYQDLLIVRNCVSKTISSNVRILLRFWRYVQGKNIKNMNLIALNDMTAYVDYLKVKYSHSYVYLQMNVIRDFFRFLYSHQYIDSNELSDYVYIRPKKELPKNLPVQEDIDQLLQQSLPLLDRAVIELYYATGMRLSELINLNIADVDFKNNLIFIREGKGKKDRIVPLTDHCLRLIEDYVNMARKKYQSKNEALFLSNTGNRITETVVRRIFKQIQNQDPDTKNMKKITPHILRHSFATHMLQNGAAVRDIQEILGHEDLGTTQRYTKVDISDLKKVIKRFHPRENEIYTDEEIILPKDRFFNRKPGCKRHRKKLSEL